MYMTVRGLITGRINEFLHQNGQTYSGISHPTSYSIDNRVLSGEGEGGKTSGD